MKRSILTFLLLLFANVNFANMHVVTNNNDTGPGSLRAQISNAANGDTITFDVSIQGQTILLTTGEISFSKSLVIMGDGVTETIIDGNQSSRIFNISGASQVVLNDLTIQNGYSTGHGGGLICENVEQLILNRTHINDNETTFSGGGIYTFSFAFPIEVEVNNSTFFNNSSAANGGGLAIVNPNQNIYTTILNSTFTGNSADLGGGVFSESLSSATTSNVSIINSTIVNNIAPTNGGGIYSNNSSAGGSDVEITSSIVAFNGTSNIFSSSINQIISGGFNIFDNISISGSVSSDQMGATVSSVNLGPLKDNNGSTFTMIPSCGSIALDMGNLNDNSDAQNYHVLGTSREVGAAESVSLTQLIVTECFSYTVPSGDETYTTPGNYIVNDTVSSSCATDSIISIDLTIKENTVHTVLNANDDGPGSLRQIVNNACPGDTVSFDASLDGTPIVLTSGYIVLINDITILGNGISNTIIDGNGTSRIFYVYNGATVSIEDISIQNGYTLATNGAGIAVDDATINLENVKIMQCEAGDYTLAGALYLGNAEATVKNCVFSGNYAGGSGGAIYQIYGGSLSIINTLISGNVTVQDGGGIYAPYPSNIELVNVTISGNYAENTYGGIMDGFTAHNTIIWGNDAVNGSEEAGLSNSTLNHSIVKGEVGINGVGNIDGTTANDPLFVQPITATITPNAGGDFHVGKFSALVDAGSNNENSTSLDLEGMSRIEDGDGNGTQTIDLGAYENRSTLGVSQNQLENISLYPNPVFDEFTVTSDRHLSKVDVYNAMGQLVESMSTATAKLKVDISDLETGVYLVKVYSAEGNLSIHKIIKK